MGKDLFYDEIEQGLAGRLDPLVFEECCIDLLQEIYPSLCHVPGGSDGGMDGAISDCRGEPFPLVCTTSPDVIGNLTKSLSRMIDEGNPRKKVVLATSDSLTARRRANLFKRAREKGFALLGVHQRSDIARLLYRESAWCKTLLKLDGNLPSLSLIPPRGPRFSPSKLVGREDQASWLTSQDGDCVVVGQPGSGKTSLLADFAKHDEALFVIDDDRDRIANEARAKSPKWIILDDAGQSLELCSVLGLIREHIGADYKIVASCWPSDLDQVLRVLHLQTDSMLELKPLSQARILDVLKQAGLRGRSGFFRELMDQSRGRPGLAFTLARACLGGSSTDVWRGDFLKRQLLSSLDGTGIRESALEILAFISLAGDRGTTPEAIASFTGLDGFHIRSILSAIGHSGVFDVSTTGSLVVFPAAIRHVLVRDTFINSAVPRDLRAAVQEIGYREQALLTVVGAVARGGSLDPAELREVVGDCTDSRVWCAFAYLDRNYGEYAMLANPSVIVNCSRELLVSSPEAVIPELLSRAVGDNRPLNSATDHPLRLLSDWIGDAGHSGAAIKRRTLLANALAIWLGNGGCSEVALQALAISLAPNYEFTDSDPLNDLAGTLTWGYIGADDLVSVASIGKEKIPLLPTMDIEDWTPLIHCLQSWVHPHLNSAPSSAWTEARLEGAKTLVKTCANHLAARPGAMRSVASLASDLGLNVEVEATREFDILYPRTTRDSDRAAIENQRADVDRLANEWLACSPAEIAAKLHTLAVEAQSAGHAWPVWAPIACSRLAKATSEPTAWISALMSHGLGGGHLEPFLGRLIEDKPDGYEGVLGEALDRPSMEWDCVRAVLKSNSASQLFSIVEESIGRVADGIRGMVMVAEVHEDALPLLLAHKSQSVREATSSALWSRHGDSMPERIYAIWRETLLGLRDDVWFLHKVFERDCSLAFDWMQAVVQSPPARIGRTVDTLSSAASVLNLEQRAALIAVLEGPRWLCWELSRLLVGKDASLYEQLLARTSLEYCWVAPLESFPDSQWLAMGAKALTAGCNEGDIVAASLRWLQLAEINSDSTDIQQQVTDSIEELLTTAAAPLSALLRDLLGSILD